MSKIELSIPRKMSTPLTIALNAEHLPQPVAEALQDLVTARSDLMAAQTALNSATGTDWGPANEKVTAATEAAEKALADFAGISAASSTAIRDSAAVAFAASMEAAHGHLQAALDVLAEASQACALHHSVTPGKPVLRLDTRAAGESKTRQRISMVRSELRDLAAQVPDSVDE